MYNFESQIDWFITITPNCFPIKSAKDIWTFFETAECDAYLSMIKAKDAYHVSDWLIRDIQKQPWFKIPFLSKKGKFYWRQVRKSIKTSINPFVNGQFEYYHGSNYFFLNRKAVEKMIVNNSEMNQLSDFYRKHIVAKPDMHPCPQETIYQTFLGSQPDLKICFNSYRFIHWEKGVNWSPPMLTLDEWELIKSSDALFARKFDHQKSKDLVQKLKHEIIGS